MSGKKKERAKHYADMFQRSRAVKRCEHGRLLVSNLGDDIDADDIRDEFEREGKVEEVLLHVDDRDRALGTAEVWMHNGNEADRAKHRLNATDVFGDGRLIRIEKPKFMENIIGEFWKTVYATNSIIDKN